MCNAGTNQSEISTVRPQRLWTKSNPASAVLYLEVAKKETEDRNKTQTSSCASVQEWRRASVCDTGRNIYDISYVYIWYIYMQKMAIHHNNFPRCSVFNFLLCIREIKSISLRNDWEILSSPCPTWRKKTRRLLGTKREETRKMELCNVVTYRFMWVLVLVLVPKAI